MITKRIDIFEGCYEHRVYPFTPEDASERMLAGDGYIRVLFQKNVPAEIFVNCSLGHVSVGDIRQFQAALDVVAEIALRGAEFE